MAMFIQMAVSMLSTSMTGRLRLRKLKSSTRKTAAMAMTLTLILSAVMVSMRS